MIMLIIFLKVCYVFVNCCCIICVNVNYGIELKYVFGLYIIFFDQVRSILKYLFYFWSQVECVNELQIYCYIDLIIEEKVDFLIYLLVCNKKLNIYV